MDILLIIVTMILIGIIWFINEWEREKFIKECVERGDIVIRIYR